MNSPASSVITLAVRFCRQSFQEKLTLPSSQHLFGPAESRLGVDDQSVRGSVLSMIVDMSRLGRRELPAYEIAQDKQG